MPSLVECQENMSSSSDRLHASKVLASALEQMDDILSGAKDGIIKSNLVGCHVIDDRCLDEDSSSVAILIEKLKSAIVDETIDSNDNDSTHKIDFDPQSAGFILKWLLVALDQEKDRQTNGQAVSYEELQQKILHLESEREHLLLQVNVLTEQVDAQHEKIVELEENLKEKKEQLKNSEAMLKQEVTLKSSLENNKLDLMAQVSALRLKLATANQERQEYEEKCQKLEGELVLTCACLAEKEADLATLKSKLTCNGTIGSAGNNITEIQKLKGALSSVIAANDEKERKIQELQTTLNRYKKLQELVFSNHGKKAPDYSHELINMNLNSEVSGSFDLFPEIQNESELNDMRLADKPPPVPRQYPYPLASSSPIHNDRLFIRESESLRCSPVPNLFNSSLPISLTSVLSKRSGSSDNVSPPVQPKTPPARRHYGTIPRQHGADILQQIHQQLQQHKLEQTQTLSLEKHADTSPNKTSQSVHNLHHPGLDTLKPARTKTSGVSFGKGFFRLRSGKRSSSAPELALQEAERVVKFPEAPRSSLPTNQGPYSASVLETKEKPKGMKKIFRKLKRTGSENLGNNDAEFKRGGIRATAGPRLGWSKEIRNFNNVNMPFAQWNAAILVEWLQYIGLGMYSNECKKNVKNGDQLLKCSSAELEKLLGIKIPLHRKKLQLAMNCYKENMNDNIESCGMLDCQWTIRWLDDIGLPQYKDSFFDARIDGRVLHHLTVEDLFNLKVTNQLHHISIKRGIQVLRENDFSPLCLKRRSLPDDEQTPLEVSKWTNHRVMEWLKTVDLSEYAPNLRGSGVHGAFMVYEPRFNADLLATLLNIPPNKTLLRRHLSTQFKTLVGAELMQKKREWEAQPNYVALSPNSKIKAVRRGQFSLMRKRNKAEVALEDYVCPLDVADNSFKSSSTEQRKSSENEKGLSPEKFAAKQNDEPVIQQEKEISANAKSIASLLQDENMAATNV